MITWLYLKSIKMLLFGKLKIIEKYIVLNYVWTVKVEHNQKKKKTTFLWKSFSQNKPPAYPYYNFLSRASNA